MLYREKLAAEKHHKGYCGTPLGFDDEKQREKRAADGVTGTDQENAEKLKKLPKDCGIKLVADELFFRHVGRNSTEKTVGYMISVIHRANDIFRGTKWLANENVTGDHNFGFTIDKIEIWNDPSKKDSYLNKTEIITPPNPKDPNQDKDHPECAKPDSRYVMCVLQYICLFFLKLYFRDICRYLKAFSKTGDHSDVCLAHLFTYYDFSTGILGLAHIGKVGNEKMGICASGKDKNGAYLNTAITTTLNWGKRILSTEAELVTVHELGHNWGASHDR